ncbi:MAG: RICIN domain-containing protein [Ruminococcus sp.]
MRFKKIRNRLICSLLVLTVTAGLLPMFSFDFSSVNAATQTENLFANATNEAVTTVGTGDYAGNYNPASFVAKVLKHDTTTYHNGIQWSTKITNTNPSSGTLATMLSNAGAGKVGSPANNDIIITNYGSAGFYRDGNVYYLRCPSVGNCTTTTFTSYATYAGSSFGGVQYIFRYNNTYDDGTGSGSGGDTDGIIIDANSDPLIFDVDYYRYRNRDDDTMRKFTKTEAINHFRVNIYNGTETRQGHPCFSVNYYRNQSGDLLGGNYTNNFLTGHYLDYPKETFRLTAPAKNLGDDFYATINIDCDTVRIDGTINDPSNKVTAKYVALNSDNVSLQSAQSNNSHIWHFTRNSDDGSYYIQNVSNNKYMEIDPTGASDADYINDDGKNVRTADKGTKYNQKWFIYERLPGQYVLRARCSRFNVLAINSSSAAPNIDVRQKKYALTETQHFSINKIKYNDTDTEFYSAISNSAGTEGLSLSNDSTAAPKFREIRKSADSQWHFIPTGNGAYAIQNTANGKYLTVSGDTPSSGTADPTLVMSNYNGGDNQQWYLVTVNDNKLDSGSEFTSGNYAIASKWDSTFILNNLSQNATLHRRYLYSKIDFKDSSVSRWYIGSINGGGYPVTLTTDNTTPYKETENLGDTFWAYISPVNSTNRYLKCKNIYNAANDEDITLYCQEAKDSVAKKKQENIWKFIRQDDGSYRIESCNLYKSSLDRRGGATLLDDDQYIRTYGNGDTTQQRWYIRKYSGGYVIENKVNGDVFTLQSDYSVMLHDNEVADNQMFNIEKTDLSIDSESLKIKANLFNYGSAINNADYPLGFHQSAVNVDAYSKSVDGYDDVHDQNYIPVMKRTLVNGMPYVKSHKKGETQTTVENKSLDYLFDPNYSKRDANGFVKGTGSQTSYDTSASTVSYESQYFQVNNPGTLFSYDEKLGRYYYSSYQNAAYFQRDKDASGKELYSGTFKLYDYTIRPYQQDYSGAHDGDANFYPFNLGHEEASIDYKNTTDDLTTRPKIDDASKTPLLNVGDYAPVSYRYSNTAKIDTWFGMSVEAVFEQTSDGTYLGNDMTLDFTGDDDVWVYIDDVLVLDIGGSHTPRSGSINFSTGDVTYPERGSDGKWTNNQVSTTLQALFNQAKAEDPSANITTEFTDAGIFKGNTRHTIKFFLLERGGAHSNFYLSFNLPTASASVTKEVENSNAELADNMEYEFQLTDENGSPFDTDATNIKYYVEQSDGTSGEEMPLESDGKFKLKNGETAYFFRIKDETPYKVTELYDPSTTAVSCKYTQTQLDELGNVVKDTNGYPIKTTTGETLVTDENGNKTSAVHNADTRYLHNLTFKNTVTTTTLTVDKDVLDKESTPLETVSDASYNFGLRVYKDNSDDTTTEYGTIKFTIKGKDIGTPYVIENLPIGANYQLWEYSPYDTVNYYGSPEFVDDANPGTIVNGTFAPETGTPSLSYCITGTIDGNKITVTNKMIEKQITVNLKYYDRNVVNGKPADIDKNETILSVSIKGDKYTDVVRGNTTIADAIKQAVNVSSEAKESIDNILDEYVLWTSLKDATLGIAQEVNLHSADNSNYAESEYHTDCYGNPQTSGEKWVTYTSNKSQEIAEKIDGELSDNDKINLQTIDVWLFNKPKTYTVTYCSADSDFSSDITGDFLVLQGESNQKTLKGIYYNQRLGDGTDTEKTEEIPNFLENYGVQTYSSKNITTSKTITVNGLTYVFRGWSTDIDGKEIISSDILYRYRVTKDITLYPVYRKEGTDVIGLTATANSVDLSFADSDPPAQTTRLNTMLNTYGCVDNDTNISDVSVIYVTDAKTAISANKASVQAAVQKALKNHTTDDKTFNGDISGIGKGNYMIHNVGDGDVNLTTKNRVQFTTTFKNDALADQKFAVFVAMKYKGTWIVSDNYIYYQFDENGKCTSNESVAVS